MRKRISSIWLLFLLAATFSIMGMLPVFATASDTVSLAWDANAEEDLAGYKVYYKTGASGAPYDGTGAAEGAAPVDVPLSSLTDAANPAFTLTELPKDTYYFAVTAYNQDGIESDYSNEVRANFKPPEAPTGLQRIVEIVVSWLQGLFGKVRPA